MPVTAGPIYPGIKDGLVFAIDPANKDSWAGPTSDTVDSLTLYNPVSGSIFNDTSGSYGNDESFAFDGTDDYIDFGHSALTAISGGSTTLSTPMTISMWFKLGSSSTSRGLINFGDLNNNYGGFSIRHESNTLSFIRATLHIVTGGYTFTDTTSWHNMILIYDPSNSSNCYVYIDGSDTGVTFNSNVGNINFLNSNLSQRNLIIGAYYGLSETFTGKIGPVLIYNRALSAGEVLQNYNRLKGRFGLS